MEYSEYEEFKKICCHLHRQRESCHSGLGIDQGDKKHRGRGRARHFENTGAGPGSTFFIIGAGTGPGSDFFFIAGAGAGPGLKKIIAGAGPGLEK